MKRTASANTCQADMQTDHRWKWDEDKAREAVEFISHLKQWQGEYQGQTLDLMPWQRQIIRDIFGHTAPSDGTRLIRTAYEEIPKKNGKTILSGAIALKLLVADDEPGAEVYTAATDRDQAKICWHDTKQMIKQNERLRERLEIVDYQNRVEDPVLNGEFKPLSKAAKKKQGLNIHGLIFDELGVQKKRELWDILSAGTVQRRQPLKLAITTAGYSQDSVCWEAHSYVKDMHEGQVDDPAYYGVIFSGDPDEYSFPPHWYDRDHPSHPEDWPEDAPYCWEVGDDWSWDEERTWYAANPGLQQFDQDGNLIKGFRKLKSMRSEVRQARHKPPIRNKFKRKYLNFWTKQESGLIDLSLWDRCETDFSRQIEEVVS